MTSAFAIVMKNRSDFPLYIHPSALASKT